MAVAISIATLAATNLRVNYMNAPVGLGHATPLFQWVPSASLNERNVSVLAAQLQVSPDLQFAQLACNFTSWDSRPQAQCPSNFTEAGSMLNWRVRLSTDGTSWGQWSGSHYGVGILSNADLSGSWIVANAGLSSDAVQTRPVRCRAILPASFLPSDVTSARVFIASPAYYTLSSNGTRLDDKSETGMWTQFKERVMVDGWDVTASVHAAEPAGLCLGIRVGGGPYPSSKFGDWSNSSGWPLLLELHIDRADGGRDTYYTGGGGGLDFSCAPDTVTSTDWYSAEQVDGTLDAALAGWDTPSFQPGNEWVSAAPSDPAALPGSAGYVSVQHATLSSTDMQHVKVWGPGLLCPVELARASDGSYVYDMGQNAAMKATLSLPVLPRGTVIMMVAGELTYSTNGSVFNQLAYGTNMTAVYTAAGVVGETMRNTFTFWGAQYIGVYGLPDGVQIGLRDLVIEVLSTQSDAGAGIAFGGVQPSSAIARALVSGELATSPSTSWGVIGALLDCNILAAVQHAILWSARSNWQGVPSDCPNREKRGWMGDASVSNSAVSWNINQQAGYKAWLRTMGDNMAQNARIFPQAAGQITVFVPSEPSPTGDTAWASAITEIMSILWRHSGDFDAIESHYGIAHEYVLTFLDKHINTTIGLMIDQALYGDWDAQFPRTVYSPNTKVLCATSSHMFMAQQMLPMAMELGLQSDVDKLHALLNASKPAYTAYFASFNASTQTLMYGDGIEQTNAVLPLALDFVPAQYYEGVVAWLINDIESTQDMHLTTGALGTRHVLHVLSRAGRIDLAAALAQQSSLPSWGFWPVNGGTTLWENWSGYADLPHPPNPTHNHIFLGSHGGWLYEVLLGLDQAPGSVGWAQPVVTPPPITSLPSMAGWLASVRGPINVSWAWADPIHPMGSGVSFAINVTFPPSVLGRVRLPVPGLSSPTIVDSGMGSPVAVWSNGAFIPGIQGVNGGREISVGPAGHATPYIELDVGQGAYAFIATQGTTRQEGVVAPASEARACAAIREHAPQGPLIITCPDGASISKVLWAGFTANEQDAATLQAGASSGVRIHKRYLATHAVEAIIPLGSPSTTLALEDLDAALPGTSLLSSQGTHLCMAALCKM